MIDLFKKLIEVKDISQQIHWSKSETGYKHEAIGSFYEAITGKTDLMIEVYQGQFGLITDYGVFSEVDYVDVISYYEEFANFVQAQRANIVEEAQHLNAIIDDILTETYLLLFKLKHL